MFTFQINESGLRVVFKVRENRVVELTHFMPEGTKEGTAGLTEGNRLQQEKEDPEVIHPILEVQQTGKSTRGMHGYKHNQCSASAPPLHQRACLEHVS